MHVAALLGQDGVQADGGLADLTVADDQLALAAPDRSHGVDGLQAGHHGLVHALALDDAGSLELHRADFLGIDRSETVDGLAQRVQDAAHDRVADRHGEDLAGALDRVAFLEVRGLAQKGHTDVVLFQVEHHALEAAGELQQLHGHGVLNAVDAGDTVTDVDHGAGLAHLHAGLIVLNLSLDDFADFFGFDLHGPTHPS
jgi:hypothetical protein